MLLSTSDGLFDIMLFGRPLTYTLKDELPFTLILSSPSTVTIGTLRSISSIVFDFESGSLSMSYSSLSMSAFTSGFWATTSTPESSFLSSFISIVPRSIARPLPFVSMSFTMSARPIELMVSTYLPLAGAVMVNRPALSVTAIFTASARLPGFVRRTVA
ncbi:unknown [Prevotella sp. CAG:1124]|nr:unknown [Prevotella sp. CAG:1124]